jgi:glycosyltransferase involved in cell wall biosynthesis
MRLLQVGKFWPPYYGGIESVHYGLHKYLESEKIDCTSIVFDVRGSRTETGVIKFDYFLFLNKLPVSFSYLSFLCRNYKNYDIIHFHFPNPIVILFFLCTYLRVNKDPKIVIHWHSDLLNFGFFDHFYNLLVRKFVLVRSNLVVLTSNSYGSSSVALRNYPVLRKVFPNFLPSSSQIVADELKDCTLSETVKLLSVGRNTDYKGHKYLVQLLDFLPSKYVLTIVGRDCVKLNIPERHVGRVTLIESATRDELDAVYNSSDLFVLGSHSRAEAFGIVLLEAMAHGLPTVCFNIPGSGIVEVVEHGRTGFLVENMNVVEMAISITNIVESENLYNLFSKNSFERSKLFCSDVICRKFLKVYKELLKSNDA